MLRIIKNIFIGKNVRLIKNQAKYIEDLKNELTNKSNYIEDLQYKAKKVDTIYEEVEKLKEISKEKSKIIRELLVELKARERSVDREEKNYIQ